MVKSISGYLYHYTSTLAARSILESATLRFHNRAQVDSGNEHEQLNARLKVLDAIWKTSPEITELFHSLLEKEQTYIACFCETFDNEYLWGHYANNGACLQLDIDEIAALRDRTIIVAYRLEYLPLEEWKNKIEPLAEELMQLCKGINLEKEITEGGHKKSRIMELILQIYISLLQTKECQFKEQKYLHEHEVRLAISPLLCIPDEAVKKIDNNGQVYLELALNYKTFKRQFDPNKIYHQIVYG